MSRGRLAGRLRYGVVVISLLVSGCPKKDGQEPLGSFSISIQGGGDGSGVVSVQAANASPGECAIVDGQAGSDCSRSFTVETGASLQITLSAAGESSRFQGWSGGGCSGANEQCRVTAHANEDLVVKATFEAVPVLALTVGDQAEAVAVLQTKTATAVVTARTASGKAIADPSFTWTSSEPDVASVSGSSSATTASVSGVSPGTASVTVSTRGVTSNAVEVMVIGPVIRGTLYDKDSVTALDSVFLTMGMVDALPGSTGYRATTGRQLAGDPVPIPVGGYRIAVEEAGRYAIFGVGVLGSRWVSTPGDTTDILPGDTTKLDLYITRGYHLDMLGTDLGTITATAGSTIDLVVDYQAWNRDLCPGCVPALAVGVDGDALNVYRFGIPGIYPGKTERGVAIPVTVPDHGGGIYAMLVTVSTGAGIEPGLQQYEARWAANLQATTMIRIGKLSVN